MTVYVVYTESSLDEGCSPPLAVFSSHDSAQEYVRERESRDKLDGYERTSEFIISLEPVL